MGVTAMKLTLIAAALAALASPAMATTYVLDFEPDATDFLRGTISTDCNNCNVTASDFVDDHQHDGTVPFDIAGSNGLPSRTSSKSAARL
jgi:hypothetical protein